MWNRSQRRVRVVMARTRRPLVRRARVARSWVARAVGLLGCRRLGEGEGLILPRCSSIHTIGMRFAIDAVFVDPGWRVVSLRPNLPPGRVLLPQWGVWGVVELAGGTVRDIGLEVGDQLIVTEAVPHG